MKTYSLLEILQPEACPFCNSILSIRMCWYNSSLKQHCDITEDGIFKYNNVNISLVSPEANMYWLGDDKTKIYSYEEERKHSDNYHFIKECYKCTHRYSVYTSELVFFDGHIGSFSTLKIRFQIDVSDIENYIVTQDLSENKTKVIFSKLKEAYSGILLPDNKSIEMPLIKLNFDSPESIINRIKTLTLLS